MKRRLTTTTKTKQQKGLATMPFSPQSIEHTEARINTMRLHAAAPELLAALESFVKWTEIHGINYAQLINGKYAEVPVVINARKAIAKATGE